MKKTYFILGGLSAVALLIAGLGAASAFEEGERERGPRGGHGDSEFKAEMLEIIQSGDYTEWVEELTEYATEKGRDLPQILEYINEGNFDQFAQMHELKQSGDKEAAKALAEEIGLPPREGKHDKKGGDPEFRAEMKEFILSTSYEEWVSKITDHAAENEKDTPKILETITSSNFDQFQEMHNLMQAGDKEAAKAIADDLGLKKRPGKMYKQGVQENQEA